MGKLIAVIVALIIIVGGGALIYSKNHKSNSTSYGSTATSSSSSKMNMPANKSNNTASSSTSSSTNSVTIENFAFSPAAVSVKKGTSITWTNKDNVAHTVTETDGANGPKSQTLNNGQTYSFTFNDVGSFHYHCSFHPQMVATVTVTE